MPLKLWRAEAQPGEAGGAAPGTVLAAQADGVRVACGSGVLKLTELQKAGGKRLPAAEFLKGFPLGNGHFE